MEEYSVDKEKNLTEAAPQEGPHLRANLSVTFSADKLTAYLLASPPWEEGEAEEGVEPPSLGDLTSPTADEIYDLLARHGVEDGVLEDAVAAFAEFPVYRSPVVVARIPMDAEVAFALSEDRMAASMTISPPQNGGKPLDEETIRAILEENKVVYGLRESVIQTMLTRPMYNLPYVVAKGQPKVDGMDGYVEDLYPRERTLKPVINEDDRADYKELNFIQNIVEGAPICNITPPVPPVDGYNVHGELLPGRKGVPAVVPAGKNTEVSADMTTLVATKCGNLVFERDKFHVEDVLVIHGNVDNSIGNIDFCGDVTITGDVSEGYTVRSEKNVLINGTVEGSSIYAAGNISLSKGMNGMYKGVLQAGGDIRCRFLENGTATAGGCIYAESVLGSTVSSQDKIIVRGRRGLIVGGKCTALNGIEARQVGSASNVATQIVLGSTSELQNQLKKVQRDIRELSEELERITKDIAYLEDHQERGEMSQERLRILGERRKAKTICLLKSSGATKQMEALQAQISSLEHCRLTCGEVHPSTRITIGNAVYTVRTTEVNKFFYYAEGEIRTGTGTATMNT